MTSSSRCRFGPFELDLETHELWKGPDPVPLTMQPAKALALLVESAGSLVTRERFYAHLWPDSVVELDQGLNTVIRQLRGILGDDAEAPVFIETVPRRGYRFVHPVVADGADGGVVPPRSYAWLVAVSAFALVATVVSIFLRDEPAEPRPVRLAVLPFEAIASDEPSELFAEGLSEELITVLGGIAPDRLAVIARTSSARFNGRGRGSESGRSVAEVGAALRADFLLEGSLRPTEDGYRVSARLVDVASEAAVWSEQHEETVSDPVSTQAWLAARVSEAIVPRLAAGAVDTEPRRDPDARVRVPWLMALHLLEREDREAAERSLAFVEEVLAADPSFARGHAALARAYLQLDREKDADPALSRAFAIAPELPEAYFLRGRKRLAEWDLAGAGSDLENAASLSPSDSRVHDYYAYYLAVTGQHARARAAISRAADIDPVASAIFADAGLFEYWGGRYEAGAEACEIALRVALPQRSHRLRARRCLLHVYEAAGRLEEALEQALAIVDAAGAEDSVRASIAKTDDPRVGLRHYFRWAAEETALPASQGSTAAYARARAWAAAGDYEATLHWLGRAVESKDPSLVQIRVEPRFEPLHDDPRFVAMVRAVGLTDSSTTEP